MGSLQLVIGRGEFCAPSAVAGRQGWKPNMTLCSGIDSNRAMQVSPCVSQTCTAFTAVLYSFAFVACMHSTGSCLLPLSALGMPVIFLWVLSTSIYQLFTPLLKMLLKIRIEFSDFLRLIHWHTYFKPLHHFPLTVKLLLLRRPVKGFGNQSREVGSSEIPSLQIHQFCLQCLPLRPKRALVFMSAQLSMLGVQAISHLLESDWIATHLIHFHVHRDEVCAVIAVAGRCSLLPTLHHRTELFHFLVSSSFSDNFAWHIWKVSNMYHLLHELTES